VGFILRFFVPSTTARVSCMVSIVMGLISASGVKQKSRFAALMMIAYGMDNFEVKDFIKTGIPLTIIGYLLILLLGATYWK